MAQSQMQTVPKGHPSGLKSLFFTEMWERLGFYLMLGILYLYITDNERGGLGMSNASAGEIYGTYMAFVYFTPFLGGMIAYRFLGFRRSVLIGGLLMAAGYFSLGIRSIPTSIVFKNGKPDQQLVGVQTEQALVSALEAALKQKGAEK